MSILALLLFPAHSLFVWHLPPVRAFALALSFCPAKTAWHSFSRGSQALPIDFQDLPVLAIVHKSTQLVTKPPSSGYVGVPSPVIFKMPSDFSYFFPHRWGLRLLQVAHLPLRMDFVGTFMISGCPTMLLPQSDATIFFLIY